MTLSGQDFQHQPYAKATIQLRLMFDRKDKFYYNQKFEMFIFVIQKSSDNAVRLKVKVQKAISILDKQKIMTETYKVILLTIIL